jgi:hypothetical protein
MTRLAQRVAALERPGDSGPPRLILICRAGKDDDELVGLGDFDRLLGETVEALKARIEQQHHAGLLVLRAHYRNAG